VTWIEVPDEDIDSLVSFYSLKETINWTYAYNKDKQDFSDLPMWSLLKKKAWTGPRTLSYIYSPKVAFNGKRRHKKQYVEWPKLVVNSYAHWLSNFGCAKMENDGTGAHTIMSDTGQGYYVPVPGFEIYAGRPSLFRLVRYTGTVK